ncbi:MAG: hypothetical protein GIX03_10875 [Candidatus Eremiobacteraeota bacterium]|nr:hypothetical protein [Candidatus Eremiobacteraeota bacterium]MBC5803474.1 hypothetical protein [Candidatus Eremiobacteraeota bacterium]MBC5821043.1 hypothetical protein [Candidatus Eremiobacteraeota bacterium]
MASTAPAASLHAAESIGTGEGVGTYRVSDDQMATGSTLGAPRICITIKASGAIEKVYSPDAGATLLGSFVVHFWDERSKARLAPLPGHFIIHPEHQEHFYSLPNGASVHETLFVLNSEPQDNTVATPAAYYRVQLSNDSPERIELSSYATCRLRGETDHDVAVAYDRKRRAFVAWNLGAPDAVRLFGVSERPASYETTIDHGKAVALTSPGKLSGTADTPPGQDTLGVFALDHSLEPGARLDFCYTFAFAHTGRGDAEANYDAAPDVEAALARTKAYYDKVLSRSMVMTPDPELNRGVLWAKANMLRTVLRPRSGWCFVNDPTRSNNSVGRDTAWFGYGADYMLPHVAKDALLAYARLQESSGMIVEYYDIRNEKTADYGLNVNDNTPLMILAWLHHYHVTGDRDGFLQHVYPAACKAARYLLSQRNDQGLIWCTSTKTSDWGIVGWRNVIENYRLSGATTELNSECYAAFRTIEKMALELERHDDAAEFGAHADELRAAINKHLYNRENGLYYLNIDVDGRARTDVTADLVFPVIFGVAEEETAANIISRLSADDFWTDAGIRTVPRGAPNYGPTHGYGLLGGVWVGVTFWYAFAAARFNSEFMAYALGTSFRFYSRDPRRNNTVPGQFSEWLHGETLVNQGMMLSPWFPPRYVWAAVEGVAGLDITSDPPALDPRLAPDWKWLGVRNVPFRGRSLTWFVVRAPDVRIYANLPFRYSGDLAAYDEDITSSLSVSGHAAVGLGLRRENELVLFIGNTVERTVTTALRTDLKLSGTYNRREYNTLRHAWKDFGTVSAADLAAGIPLELDRKGFSVLELTGQT